MKRSPIDNLVPGRVRGQIERDPARSGPNKILLLRQAQLDEILIPPAGVVLVEAAPFSHGLIRWLGRGVPMGLMDAVESGRWGHAEQVVLDSAAGELRAATGAQIQPWRPPPARACGTPVRMADGTPVQLCASVADDAGMRRAVASGAASIGLVRSELLLPLDDSRPDAAFYRRELARLIRAAGPLEVTIRLLDLAPDKRPPWSLAADQGAAPQGAAPVRLHGSLLFHLPDVRAVLDAQLAALASLPSPHRLRLIWPSGARLEDFVNWRDHARRTLPSRVAIGAMIEAPLETLALGRWLTEADFVAIGCNDLLQHLCAADRDDPAQRLLLDPYRPELFRFLRAAAAPPGLDLQRVQLCGLLPQIDGVLPALVGLGYRSFSGEPLLLPLLGQSLETRTLEECRALAAAVCACATADEVRQQLGTGGATGWGLVH